MFHIYDMLTDASGDVRHLLWRGCDGELVIRTRPYDQSEQDFFAQWPPTKPECCAPESRTYLCSDVRALSRAAGSSGKDLLMKSFLPLDLAARMCWPRRKQWDILRIIRDFGEPEGSLLFEGLSTINRATEQRLTVALEAEFPGREIVAARYSACLCQLANALAEDLADRKVYMEDELAFTPFLRQLETNPLNHLTVQPDGLLALMAERQTFEGWSSSNKSIAIAAGVRGNPPASGLLPCLWTQYGTWTGRVTASVPPLQAAGEDKFVDTRRLLGARDGYALIACDWRKAELQALAKLTRQDRVNTPSWAIYEPLPEDKSLLFRMLYGGAKAEEFDSLAPLLQRAIKDVRAMMVAYNFRQPQRVHPLGNVPLSSPVCLRCPPAGVTCTLCGRKREREDRSTDTQVNWMLQASVAAALRTLLPFLSAALAEHGGYIVLLRHD